MVNVPAISLAFPVCRHLRLPLDERAWVDSYLSITLDVGHLIVLVLKVTRRGVRRLNGQPHAAVDGRKRRLRVSAKITLTVVACITAARGACTAKTWRHTTACAAVPERLID